MKRDMDLIRQLLLAVEANPEARSRSMAVIEGRSSEEIAFHCLLLMEAGFVDGSDASTRGGDEFYLHRLTWEGAEFLDLARSDTVWNKAVAVVKEKGISVGVEVMKALLVKIGSSMLGVGG